MRTLRGGACGVACGTRGSGADDDRGRSSGSDRRARGARARSTSVPLGSYVTSTWAATLASRDRWDDRPLVAAPDRVASCGVTAVHRQSEAPSTRSQRWAAVTHMLQELGRRARGGKGHIHLGGAQNFAGPRESEHPYVRHLRAHPSTHAAPEQYVRAAGWYRRTARTSKRGAILPPLRRGL